jgi:hypothetical protein
MEGRNVMALVIIDNNKQYEQYVQSMVLAEQLARLQGITYAKGNAYIYRACTCHSHHLAAVLQHGEGMMYRRTPPPATTPKWWLHYGTLVVSGQ